MTTTNNDDEEANNTTAITTTTTTNNNSNNNNSNNNNSNNANSDTTAITTNNNNNDNNTNSDAATTITTTTTNITTTITQSNNANSDWTTIITTTTTDNNNANSDDTTTIPTTTTTNNNNLNSDDTTTITTTTTTTNNNNNSVNSDYTTTISTKNTTPSTTTTITNNNNANGDDITSTSTTVSDNNKENEHESNTTDNSDNSDNNNTTTTTVNNDDDNTNSAEDIDAISTTTITTTDVDGGNSNNENNNNQSNQWQLPSRRDSGIPADQMPCKAEWIRLEDQCYWFETKAVNWTEAVATCASNESHLVVITNVDQQRFIESYLKTPNHWIGLSRPTHGEWTWADTTNFTETSYTNWALSEPPRPTNTDVCGFMSSKKQHIGVWLEDDCSSNKKPICQTSVACQARQVNLSSEIIPNVTITIPSLSHGRSFASTQICVCDGRPVLTARCSISMDNGNATLDIHNNTDCHVTPPVIADTINKHHNNVFREMISEATENENSIVSINDVATKTNALLASKNDVSFADIVYIAYFLQSAVNTNNGSNGEISIGKETAEQLLQMGSSILELSSSPVPGFCEQLGNRVIQLLEKLIHKISFNGTSVRIVTDSIAVEVWNLTDVVARDVMTRDDTMDDVILGLEVREEDGKAPKVDGSLREKSLVSVQGRGQLRLAQAIATTFLTGKFLRQIAQQHTSRPLSYVTTVYTQNPVFASGTCMDAPGASGMSQQLVLSNRNLTLNSVVVSSTLLVDGKPQSDLGEGWVTNIFQPRIVVPDFSKPNNTVCVFWNMSGNGGRGAWSNYGCYYNTTKDGRDICVCDHLTNFAVLMDLDGVVDFPGLHKDILTYITIVGLSLSIAGLSVTLLSFMFIRKLRHGRAQKTLFNMALSMLMSWVVFLAGFERTENDVACLVVAILLHYLILTSFCWMLMEGLLQFLLFVRVMGTHIHSYMLKTTLFAWGVPVIPVATVLIVDRQMYDGSEQYCWMSLQPFYFAFLAPIGVIIFVNVIIYVMVVTTLCCRGKRLVTHTGQHYTTIGLRASVACFVVLGLSWIFAFLAVEDARLVFQYLFTITASTQGLLVFLIFTAREPAVRKFWRERFAACFCHSKSCSCWHSDRRQRDGRRRHLCWEGKEVSPPPTPLKGVRMRTMTIVSNCTAWSSSTFPSDFMDTEEGAKHDLHQND